MLLTRAVRPDRLIIAAKSFVSAVFGNEFVQKSNALLNLETIINDEVIPADKLFNYELIISLYDSLI